MCKSMWLQLPAGRDSLQGAKDQVLRRTTCALRIWGPAGCPLKAFPDVLSNITAVPAQTLCVWVSVRAQQCGHEGEKCKEEEEGVAIVSIFSDLLSF